MYIYLDIAAGFQCEMCGSCCRNDWVVTVDAQSFSRNARLFAAAGREQEFAKAFIRICAESSPGEYAYIAKQPAGGCWFLQPDQLCRLHREAGHAHLDSVCRTFPRYPLDTARGLELTLSFSCPAVIRLVSRQQPLAIVRSEQAPLAVMPDSCVAQVYPQQYSDRHPLYYYFELEHHFIDILQCRLMPVQARVNLLFQTVEAIGRLDRQNSLHQDLNRLIYSNYVRMDKVDPAQPPDMADILTEHFLVNFVFKKPFYLCGLQPGARLVQHFCSRINAARSGIIDPAVNWQKTKECIMELEFQYGHNRKALYAGNQ
ncbi:flagellin lysine-N-methylase [Acetonema longum]|uniref:Putative FliB family protein n=1 Tax=Acetonema longum DSM 6540 TaxID=1009370 RepID=F7NGX4_9FIRM|nr:flagellin lysine-N-methylase [Acetonema longum]EGO64705.1 putative FliB family protein [Acetonema longum DSM 6540]